MATERTTISLDPDIAKKAGEHCKSRGFKFSNYVENLIRKDLISEGVLGPCQDEQKRAARDMANELIELDPVGARAGFKELLSNALVTQDASL